MVSPSELPEIAAIEEDGQWISGRNSGHREALAAWLKNGALSKLDTKQVFVQFGPHGQFQMLVTFYRRSVIEKLIRERCTRRPKRKRV